MSGVYFADNRPLVTVELLLKSILLTHQPPCTHSYSTNKGLIFQYPREDDVNILFRPDILNKLKENGLTPEFSHKTQEDRLIIIPNVPEEIYYKDNNIILMHINEINNTNVLKVDRYITRNNIRYLKIFLDSKQAQINWIEKGKIKVFQILLRAEAAHNKTKAANPNKTHYSQINYVTGSRTGQTQRSALPQNCTWGRSNGLPTVTHDHRNNRPRSHDSHSNWDEARPNRHNAFTGNSINHSRHYDSDHEMKLFSYTSIRLTESLYNGLEYPDVFTDMFNQILYDNGHKVVNVPHNVKVSSRNKFLHSNTRYVNPQNHSLQQMPPHNNYLHNYPPMPPTNNYLHNYPPMPPTVKPPTLSSSVSHPSAPPGSPPPPPPTPSAPPVTPASAPPIQHIQSPISSTALLDHPKLPQPDFTPKVPSPSNSTSIISNPLTSSPPITTPIKSKSPANLSSIKTPIISNPTTISPSISSPNTSTSNTHRISSLSPSNLPHNTISNSPKATTSPTPPNPTPIPITNIQSLPMPLLPIQFKPGSFFTPNPSGSNPLISHTTPRNTQVSQRKYPMNSPYHIPPFKSRTSSKSIGAIEQSNTQPPSYSLRSLGNASLLPSSN